MNASPVNPRVLYVTYDGLLEPLGGSQVIPYVEGLAAHGVEITVLSFEKARDLQDVRRREDLAARLGQAGIEWLRLRYHRRPSMAATLYDVGRGVATGLRCASMTRRAPRIVHARSYVAAVIALALKRATGARFVFDTRSLLIDERIDCGMWRRDSTTVRVFRSIERRLLAEADATVLVARRGIAVLDSLLAERPSTVHVIPPCVDLERFRPALDRASLRASLGLSEEPLIVHAGALSSWYLAEKTFEVGEAFARRTGGRFLVLTKEVEFAERLKARLGSAAIVRAVHHEEVPRWLAAADAGLALVRPDPAKRASSPVKVGEYLACGLAVAATRGVGDLEEHFADSTTAFTVDPAEPSDAIAERLVVAASRPSRIEASRALAARHYSLERGIASYAAIYAGLQAIDAHGVAPQPTRETV